MFVEMVNRTKFVRKKRRDTKIVKIVREHKRGDAVKMTCLRDRRKM